MYFLGIDAGGTKTAFVLSDENGRILARYNTGTGAFFSVGSDGLTAILSEGAASVCKRAGINASDLTFAALGVPGYGEKEGGEEEIQVACAKAGLTDRIVCECDCYIGWAGSLAMKPGINVIAGTGANCYGVNSEGKSARSSGWGGFCDEGSCRWLGERLVELYTKQADGRLPRTVLYDMFRRHFGIEYDLHFIHTLNHELARDDVKTAGLQILLGEICDAGDGGAQALYNEAAEELALAASAVAHKLDFSGDYAVSYSGGLFRSGERILKPLTDSVSKRGGRLCAPKFAPELGAVLMAMRHVLPDKDFESMTFTE